jgi:hypothetical protein
MNMKEDDVVSAVALVVESEDAPEPVVAQDALPEQDPAG